MIEECDEYLLYENIGMIPEDFREKKVEVSNTTRSVCRRLCSETYDLTCSGFLYNRRLQKCELSPYTGEWVTTAGLSFNSSSGLEFYRRIRCTGHMLYYLIFLMTEALYNLWFSPHEAVMLARSWVILSVCPSAGVSVCLSHSRYFDTTWKGNHSSFLTPTEVGERCLPPEICA